MKTSLLFGRQELLLDLPEKLKIHEINKYPMPLLEDVDGSILSTEVAKGFVGSYLGLHARVESSPDDERRR